MKRKGSVAREKKAEQLYAQAYDRLTAHISIQPPQRLMYLLPNPHQVLSLTPKFPFQPPAPPKIEKEETGEEKAARLEEEAAAQRRAAKRKKKAEAAARIAELTGVDLGAGDLEAAAAGAGAVTSGASSPTKALAVTTVDGSPAPSPKKRRRKKGGGEGEGGGAEATKVDPELKPVVIKLPEPLPLWNRRFFMAPRMVMLGPATALTTPAPSPRLPKRNMPLPHGAMAFLKKYFEIRSNPTVYVIKLLLRCQAVVCSWC